MVGLSQFRIDRTFPSGVVWAFVAAAGVHLVGSWALLSQGWVGRGDAVHSGRSLHVRLSSSATLPASAFVDAQEAASADPAAVATPESASEAESLLTSTPPAAGREATIATAYLPADELDALASPEHGWVLDEMALQQAGRSTLRLQLWVSAQGRIDRVMVLQATPVGEWVNKAIAPLHQTPMHPAERQGRFVASTLVVEIASDLESLQ